MENETGNKTEGAKSSGCCNKTILVLTAIAALIIFFALGFLVGKRYPTNSLLSQTRQSITISPEAKPTANPSETTPKPTQTQLAGEISLEILSPANGTTVTSSLLTVKGKTAPNADVFINDKELKSDSQGSFITNLTLDEGENTIVVVANDEQGNAAEKEITVTYSISE